VAFALVAITGDIYCGLWYPVVVVSLTVIVGVCLLPETAGRAADDRPRETQLSES